eukprot:7204777-Lingulodinium_polyedra.AAC.1
MRSSGCWSHPSRRSSRRGSSRCSKALQPAVPSRALAMKFPSGTTSAIQATCTCCRGSVELHGGAAALAGAALQA